MDRFCKVCGASISHRGPTAKYCEECAKKQENIKRYEQTSSYYNGNLTKQKNEQCEQCWYYNAYGAYCDYATITRKTRLGLHRGENVDINNPCREFKPKRRGGRK